MLAGMRSAIRVVALVAAVAVAGCGSGGAPEARGTWTGPAGRQLTAYAGEEHCDWQSLTVLELDDQRRYVRDPDGLVGPEWLTGTYEPRATLPGDATNTGFTHGDQQLWLSSDKSAAYVVAGDATEQWPGIVRGWGCD
jgi:hypothetical protein